MTTILTGTVDVTVNLAPSADRFMASGLDATFAWNLANNVSVTLGPSGNVHAAQRQSAWSLHFDGFGSFEYGVQKSLATVPERDTRPADLHRARDRSD